MRCAFGFGCWQQEDHSAAQEFRRNVPFRKVEGAATVGRNLPAVVIISSSAE